jgi:hypothetical protein
VIGEGVAKFSNLSTVGKGRRLRQSSEIEEMLETSAIEILVGRRFLIV